MFIYATPPTDPPHDPTPYVDRGELVFPAPPIVTTSGDKTYLNYRDISLIVPSDQIPVPPEGYRADRYVNPETSAIIWAEWGGYYPWYYRRGGEWIEHTQDMPIEYGWVTWVFWRNTELNSGHMPGEMRFDNAGKFYHRPNIHGEAVFDWAGPGDFDLSGSKDVFDYLAFLNAFTLGDMTADYERNGTLDLFDFMAFFNAWESE